MSVSAAPRRRAVLPPAPATLEQSGLSFDAVVQLVMKTLHLGGERTGADLAERLGLRYSVIEPVLTHLRMTYLCDVAGGGLIGGPSFMFRITDGGRARAMLFLEQSHYVGVAPVPFSQYEKYMRMFDENVSRTVTRARVQQAFSHLVLSDRVIDQVGPAVNGGHSLFVYGPPGNGKTVIAQGIKNLLEGDIAIPHAVDYDGHLVQVYDTVVHETRPHLVSDDLDTGDPPDARWLRCRRPLVTVGGELIMSSLELAYDTTSGIYRAPIQLAANGGVLVIDDFGRQRCSVVELLNRWITPLESRTDYLTLDLGSETAHAVRGAGGPGHQHQAGRSRGRSLPAPHPLQGVRGESHGAGFQADLPARVPRQGRGVQRRGGRQPHHQASSETRRRPARMPSARLDRPCLGPRRLPRRAAGADRRAA